MDMIWWVNQLYNGQCSLAVVNYQMVFFKKGRVYFFTKLGREHGYTMKVHVEGTAQLLIALRSCYVLNHLFGGSCSIIPSRVYHIYIYICIYIYTIIYHTYIYIPLYTMVYPTINLMVCYTSNRLFFGHPMNECTIRDRSWPLSVLLESVLVGHSPVWCAMRLEKVWREMQGAMARDPWLQMFGRGFSREWYGSTSLWVPLNSTKNLLVLDLTLFIPFILFWQRICPLDLLHWACRTPWNTQRSEAW